MIADKRITTTDYNTGQITKTTDSTKKIKIINNKYIVSYAGRVFVTEQAFHFIDQNIKKLSQIIDPLSFFKEAFSYGKERFEKEYPGIEATSIFYLGYIDQKKPKLIGFSSDDNYTGIELEMSIKIHAPTPEEEDIVRKETEEYIYKELMMKKLRGLGVITTREYVDIYFESIKRIDNIMIGKTAYSVVLSSSGIKENHHV